MYYPSDGQNVSSPKPYKYTFPIPARPIVNSINTPSDQLSRYLHKVLTPLLRHVPSYLPNTDTFLRKLKEEKRKLNQKHLWIGILSIEERNRDTNCFALEPSEFIAISVYTQDK
ncbi:hypothetical protein GJ496_003406 [Pomphorhynchus laevis]|nr:hypothetical protein GJ496_003406 [Pomphorhynchus laevis]